MSLIIKQIQFIEYNSNLSFFLFNNIAVTPLVSSIGHHIDDKTDVTHETNGQSV